MSGWSSAARLSTPVSAHLLRPHWLPPAFLAPRIRAQSLSTRSRRQATPSPPERTTTNAAFNVKGALRRLGQGSKWSQKPPAKARHNEHSSPRPRAPPASQRSQRSQKQPRSANGRLHYASFRLRAKQLLDHVVAAMREMQTRPRHLSGSPDQLNAQINEVLSHFESEMKALRVMIKSKDALVDPDNALKSASRIKAPYNAVIRLCIQNSRIEQAFKLLNQMKKDGIFPSAATYGILITGLSNATQMLTPAASASEDVTAETQPKHLQRIREVYQDLETLWKQAFPQYFRTGRQISSMARPKDLLPLGQADLNSLSEQTRRNTVSQQASIAEVRENPQVLTTAIGAYAYFLGGAGLREEMQQLFDRLFPPSQIDEIARGLSPNASPQEKLELANRKLADWLPLGNVPTLSIFLTGLSHKDPERSANIEDVWSRAVKLMQIDRYESGTVPQAPLRRSQSSTKLEQKKTARSGHDTDVHSTARFIPDDKFMQTIFTMLLREADRDPSRQLRLAYEIVSKVYGLDLESAADGILRDPRSMNNTEMDGYQRYLLATHDDGSRKPPAVLRDPATASSLIRLLSKPASSKQAIALFNYLWAIAYAEHQEAEMQADSVGTMVSDAAVFGTTLTPACALNLLYVLAEDADAVACRLLLDAMNQAAAQLHLAGQSGQKIARRIDRRSKQADSQASQISPQDWKPRDIVYQRALRANLMGVLHQPSGLTAVQLSGSLEESQVSKYDAWDETKSLFCEWSDQRHAGNGHHSTSHWGADINKAPAKDAGFRKSGNRDGRDAPDALSRMHTQGVYSLFLGVASVYAAKHVEKGVRVAREALELIQARVGLETVAMHAKEGHEEIVDKAKSSTSPSAIASKMHISKHLRKILDLALDTSDHTFAPKESVELWKRIKRTLPTDSVEARSGSQKPRSYGSSSSVRGKHPESSRLLLSREDYLELEAEAAVEDDEAQDVDRLGHDSRSSLRMQRRSRHVEQELERWVRGASS